MADKAMKTRGRLKKRSGENKSLQPEAIRATPADEESQKEKVEWGSTVRKVVLPQGC